MTQSALRLVKDEENGEARRLAESARIAGVGGSPDDAIRGHGRALTLLEKEEETPLLADVLRWQAVVLSDRGQTTEAEPLLRRSLAIATRLNYEAGQAHALNQISSLALRRGDLIHAANLMTDALEIAERCGESHLVGMLQQNLGIVADVRGNPAAALAHYRRGLRTFEEKQDEQTICGVLNNLGYLHTKEGHYPEAGALLDRALSIAQARGYLLSEGIIEENRAELQLVLGNIDNAYLPLSRALQIAEQRNDDIRRAGALKLRGAYERLTRRPDAAVDTLRYAASLSIQGEYALLNAEILYQLGLAQDACGDRTGARESWNAAISAFERIEARQWMGRVRQRLSGGNTSRYL